MWKKNQFAPSYLHLSFSSSSSPKFYASIVTHREEKVNAKQMERIQGNRPILIKSSQEIDTSPKDVSHLHFLYGYP